MTNFRAEIAAQFHLNAQVPRSVVFGDADERYAPVRYREDSDTMFAGFVGSRYEPGGAVFFGINPGGGGDKHQRHPDDKGLYPLLRAFRDANDLPPIGEFEAVNDTFSRIVKNWNLWRILQPSLEAFSLELPQICYLNVVPYRTRENKKPPVAAQSQSWSKLIAPTLAKLQPDILVALGKAVGGVIERFNSSTHRIYVIPRTNGDNYISADAKRALSEIRHEFRT